MNINGIIGKTVHIGVLEYEVTLTVEEVYTVGVVGYKSAVVYIPTLREVALEDKAIAVLLNEYLTDRQRRIGNGGFSQGNISGPKRLRIMGYFIVYLFGIKSIAIELFQAKSHRALLYVKRMTRLKLSYSF